MKIETRLFGKINKEILYSVQGQLSDGIWENSPRMSSVWRNFEVESDENDQVILNINVDRWDSPFRGKDPCQICEYFANKIKQVVKENIKDNGYWNTNLVWDRNCEDKVEYMGGHECPVVTVKDAYFAYETLKGRI